jgi:hypothetical protein
MATNSEIVNENICEICRGNGFYREECNIDCLMVDLMCFLNNNIVDNTNYISGIEQILNNIRDHTNMSNEELLALLSYAVLTNRTKLLPNITKFDIKINVSTEINKVKELEPEYCVICLENVDASAMATFNCEHSFCNECVIKTIDHSKKSITKHLTCYLCRRTVNSINIFDDKNIYNELKEKIHC